MSASKRRYATTDLVVDALSIALVLAFAMFVNLRLPFGNGGLIHLGNVPLFLAAFCFGRRTGALAGGLGMAMFDLISGWVPWSPFTLVICGAMGYVVGLFSERSGHRLWGFALGTVLALVLKLAGYYAAEGLLYGNWIAPLASVPGNLIQVGAAMAITLPLALPMRKLMSRILHSKEV